MKPVEIFQEWGEGDKREQRGGEFKYDIFHTL
jgi:hypothetical protein